jgi:sulfur carrier protein ThiS
MVKILLNLSLKEYTKVNNLELNIEHEVPLLDILEKLGIPGEQVGMVIKNGKWAAKSSCTVSNDDIIELFPQLSGG